MPESCLYCQDFQSSKLLSNCLPILLNAVYTKYIARIFQVQPFYVFLKCWDLEDLTKFSRKHIKHSETTVLSHTFCLKYWF